MSELQQRFEKAQEVAKAQTERPDNDTLLNLYSFFKQASVGDVQGDRPGFLDFVGQAKYDAWAKLEGMDSHAAMEKYIETVMRFTGERL
jgi:acyl-CoA-binding protein